MLLLISTVSFEGGAPRMTCPPFWRRFSPCWVTRIPTPPPTAWPHNSTRKTEENTKNESKHVLNSPGVMTEEEQVPRLLLYIIFTWKNSRLLKIKVTHLSYQYIIIIFSVRTYVLSYNCHVTDLLPAFNRILARQTRLLFFVIVFPPPPYL